MVGSSSTIQVPGSQVKLERTCSADAVGLRVLDGPQHQHATARRRDLEHLVEADLREPPRGRHDARVRAEHARDVGVDLADRRAEGGGERDRGDRSVPPRPSVVTSRSVETPWNPATTGTWPCVERLGQPVGPDVEDLGPRVVGVGDDAGLAAGERRGLTTPRSASAMHSSEVEIRSPTVASMSSSRGGCTEETSAASRRRSSVVLPIAETTTTTSSPPAACAPRGRRPPGSDRRRRRTSPRTSARRAPRPQPTDCVARDPGPLRCRRCPRIGSAPCRPRSDSARRRAARPGSRRSARPSSAASSSAAP